MSNYNFFIKNMDKTFSPNTIRIAEYIARLSDKTQNEIELDKKQTCQTLNISYSTLNKALKTLTDTKIIQETNTSTPRNKKYEWIFTPTQNEQNHTTNKQPHKPNKTSEENQNDNDNENRIIGVGPWPGGKENWPTEDHYDPQLLEHGDKRNVLDHYRYWKMSAIIADLDENYRTPLHIAIENLEHDYNIGSIVRSANAFGVNMVHIVGRKRWNRRGAMVTDRYQHIMHHSSFDDFTTWCKEHNLPLIGIDILEGSKPIEKATFPQNCMMLFGQEGAGISKELLEKCDQVLHITQRGSTRSINVGAAAAIAMYSWGLQHATDF